MLDVVGEFSSIINNSSLAFFKQPVTYEGRAIPGSPIEVTVASNPSLMPPKKKCTGAELGSAPGTWVLSNVSDRPEGPINFTAASFSWLLHTCRMPELHCILAASRRAANASSCLDARHTVMVYAIGDSVTRVQAQPLANLLGEVIEGEGETYIQKTKNTVFDIHSRLQMMV